MYLTVKRAVRVEQHSCADPGRPWSILGRMRKQKRIHWAWVPAAGLWTALVWERTGRVNCQDPSTQGITGNLEPLTA